MARRSALLWVQPCDTIQSSNYLKALTGETLTPPRRARHNILTSADLAEGRLSFTQGSVSIGWNEHLTLIGTKIDSLVTISRQKVGDPQTIYAWEVPDLLKATVYYTLANGQKIALIPDFVADRATGELLKFSYVVTLNLSDWELNSYGAVNHGFYNPNDAAPITKDDLASTAAGQDIRFDVLANDRDPEGRYLAVDGFTDPHNGDVFQQEDGTLLYRTNRGFTGTDSFEYWAADDMGHFTKATVTVEVWDL